MSSRFTRRHDPNSELILIPELLSHARPRLAVGQGIRCYATAGTLPSVAQTPAPHSSSLEEGAGKPKPLRPALSRSLDCDLQDGIARSVVSTFSGYPDWPGGPSVCGAGCNPKGCNPVPQKLAGVTPYQN